MAAEFWCYVSKSVSLRRIYVSESVMIAWFYVSKSVAIWTENYQSDFIKTGR